MHDVTVTVQTHRGAVRPVNEDAVTIGSIVAGSTMNQPVRLSSGLSQPMVFAVSDGIGGQKAGEIASEHVARRLAELGSQLSGASGIPLLLRTLDEELTEHAGQNVEFDGMGTTVAGLLIAPDDDTVRWFNVGDSRVYRVDGVGLTQITVDDSPAGGHVPTNYITQSLGGGAQRAVEPHHGDDHGTAWLVCSDGLSDLVDDDRMSRILEAAPDDVHAVYGLWSAAMDAGGKDNISIVLVRAH